MPQAGQGVSPAEAAAYVGIDTLQEQTRQKALLRGYTFNLLVVGRSGLGKSTLVNTLFKSSVARKKDGQQEPLPPTTQVKKVETTVCEGGVKLHLTITDTPGFGDHINNENCWNPIISYIEEQYKHYLEEEQKVQRMVWIPDTRIHCCLYFIPPSGHSLSSLDVEVLSRLEKIVNVVPIIAKADTLTIEERDAFKERIRADLKDHGIMTYPLEVTTDIDYSKIKERVPFAVVGSYKWHEVHGRKVLGRRSTWGLVEVENKAHNDFAFLRDMLIRTHMQDLIDSTAEHHYENFRRFILAKTPNGETLKATKEQNGTVYEDMQENNSQSKL